MSKNGLKRIKVCVFISVLLISLASGLAPSPVSADSVFSETSTPWYRTGNGVFDVELEDIDLDGYLDVITANDYEKKFYILTNDQRGNFENLITYNVSNTQRSIEIGDVDGDTDLDIVTTNPSNDTITIMFNLDGLGTFGGEMSYYMGDLPYHFYLGDIDNDNDLDIVTANFGPMEYNISVLKNNGSGFFGNLNHYWVGFRPLGIHMGDLNGDNYIDVVTAHQEIDKIAILYNDGAGRFMDIANYSVPEYPSSVFVGDVDGDTHNDIVVAGGDYALNRDEDMISVFKNDGTGDFESRIDYEGGDNPHSLKLGDIDSDGDLDAVTVNSDHNLGVFLNDGDGAFKTKLEFPTGGHPYALRLGDLDNDLDLDVVVATDKDGTKDRIYVLTNEGNGWFNIITNYPTTDNPISVYLGDIDGDDDLDMVSANFYGRTISVYFNDDEANYGNRMDYAVENWLYPNTVALADMDNDNDLDLFYSGGGANPTGHVSLRKNNGNGIFGTQTDYTMGSYPRMYIAEINGDIYPDIVTVNQNDNDLSKRINNGAGDFFGETTFGGSDGLSVPSAICMGDIDWDTDLDIVVADSGFNHWEAVVFRNNGAGTFTHLADYPVGEQPKGVTFGDVDKDGDNDIITANQNDDTISVLINSGFGSYGTSTDYPVGEEPLSVATGDVDGDDDNDIISANFMDGTITVYKNNGFGGFGFRVDYPLGVGVECVNLIDIDKDVDLDIVCVDSNRDNITIILNRNNYDFYLDSDQDGFPDYFDDFPDNGLEWIDSDKDGWGDNSDELPWDPFEHVDSDGDRHGDQFDDAFPQDPTEWDDTDGDGWGDNSDAFPQDNTEWFDSDEDGVGNNADFMPLDDTQKYDSDGDGYGDNPDGTNGDEFPDDSTEWRDTDGDGYGDNLHDAFPNDETQWSDTDSDGYGDDINGNDPDMFPNNPLEWGDNDVDDIGDNTDDDDDNDGYSDNMEQSYGTDPLDYSEHPADYDSDYIPDDTDEDDDNDGFSDTMEQNLGYNSKDPTDFPPDNDYDGIPDAVDEDDDNDGWSDGIDAFPTNPAAWEDTDSDGKPDEVDTDADNPTNLVEDTDDDSDGYNDTEDDFPTNKNEWTDTDNDGTGDNSDADMDNDGWSNYVEESAGSDPLDKNDVPTDTDSDGIADNADLDDDNDGVLDYDDFAPLDASVQKDPNLIRIAGVEFEVGELVIGILMAAGALFLGSVVLTRKKRLYSRYKHQINDSASVSGLNEINTGIKSDGEKERLTYMQMTMLKEQYDDKYMTLRESELEDQLGELPTKVQERIREVISDQIITEDEFEDMQKWLVRLRDSKTFDSEKKAKLQEVLSVWVDENIE